MGFKASDLEEQIIMEEIKPKEKTLNIKDLEGETLDINLAQIQEIEGEFEKQVIHAPDEYSFDNDLFRAILDGFTEGALKNFITVSKEKTRLYKITQDSIKLLSCFKTPFNTSGRPLASFTAILNTSSCSLQIFPSFSEKIPVAQQTQNAKSFLLKFDFSTGALLKMEDLPLPKNPKINSVFKPETLKPNFSKTDSYLIANLNLQKPESLSIEIGRLREGGYSPWMRPNPAFDKKLSQERARYQLQTLCFGHQLKRNFTYDYPLKRMTAFRYIEEKPDLALIISPGHQQYFFFLIDLRMKKILKSRSINLVDLLGKKGIEDIMTDPLQGEAAHQYNNIAQWSVFSPQFAYFPDKKSLFLLARLKKVEITFKITNFFLDDPKKDLKVTKRRKIVESKNILKKYGRDKLLTYYSGEVRSTYLRPLAWLDLETLEETKIAGLEKKGRSHLLFKVGNFWDGTYAKLTKNRILVRNQILVFIYDFELDQVIDEQVFCFKTGASSKFTRIDDLFIGNDGEQIHLLRTKKDGESGSEVPFQQKIIHFNDLTPNLSAYVRSDAFSCFKLTSGNYLYVAEKHLEEKVRARGNNAERLLISVEIDQKTLKVNKFTTSSETELNKLKKYTTVSNFHLCSDLLVFTGEMRESKNCLEEQQEEMFINDRARRNVTLILASTDFTILNHCRQAKIDVVKEITQATSNRIVSLDADMKAFLHEVDAENKRLVFLKSLNLQNAVIFNGYNFLQSKSHFCLSTHNGVFLKFNRDLELVGHLKVRGMYFGAALFPLKGNRVAFCRNPTPQSRCQYVVDLRTGEVGLAHKYWSIFRTDNYVIESYLGEERVACLDMKGEKIVKVILG